MLGKYSLGIGDRFAKEGVFQLEAFVKAKKLGKDITPVWNKSYREHKTVGSKPSSVRKEADESVAKCSWKSGYLVDADHITIQTVEDFIPYSDFFTIDVANQIGHELTQSESKVFLEEYRHHIGNLDIQGIDETFEITEETLLEFGNKFYKAVKESLLIYQKIKEKRQGYFAVEVSMDEVEVPQTPLELYFILILLSKAGIPVNTIAPKFTGRFNKGVDYRGDLAAFEKEFEQDLLVIAHCVEKFDLPKDLKLSIHSGSDKFLLYPIINRLIKKHHCGLHLKTAGTTWLEELIGLAESGGSGLEMVKSIYAEAYSRFDELTVPYVTVIEVDKDQLPKIETVNSWEGNKFSETLRHDQKNSSYDSNFRQFLHTSYKIAAEKGDGFIEELEKNSEHIGRNVTENIFDKHINPLFI